MAFQQPVTVPGVTYIQFLRAATRTKLPPLEFYNFLLEKAKILKIPPEFLARELNLNFSGGEKKKMELFQALVLAPQVAILDEPDSGVDAANLRLLVKAIKMLLENATGVLLITHSESLIKKLRPAKIYRLRKGQSLC